MEGRNRIRGMSVQSKRATMGQKSCKGGEKKLN